MTFLACALCKEERVLSLLRGKPGRLAPCYEVC